MTDKKTAEEIVATKYGLGKTLVTGHKAAYWQEAMVIYAAQELAEYKAKLKEAIHETIDDPEGIVDRDFIRAKTVYQLIDKL